jgi:two-component system alkaline phosphatase synthesis response regulator PhoP
MSETILVVDDDRAIAQLLAIRISAAGYKALTASDSKTGLEAAILHRPRVILLDIRMPEMDGFEFHRRLKEVPEVAQTPVIFISANSQESARRKALISGARYFLTKPCEPRELLGAIRAILSEQPCGAGAVR